MITFKIPGKTFLFGEYLATQGGSSLIFTSSPCFEFVITENNSAIQGIFPFHADSPVGQLYTPNQDILKNRKFTLNNPYQRGGLGASTAEYLGLYQYLLYLKNEPTLANETLVQLYQSHNTKAGVKPSGADLIAQFHQGVSYYYPLQNIQKSYVWPFKQLSLLLFHTNQKLATHEHLNRLKLPKNLSNLQPIANKTFEAFLRGDAAQFCQGITAYGKTLGEYKLISPHTSEIINKLKRQPQVLATKGCGAMGADVFMVLCDPLNKTLLSEQLQEQQFPLIATEASLCNKLQITLP